jgi:hypothetical protein
MRKETSSQRCVVPGPPCLQKPFPWDTVTPQSWMVPEFQGPEHLLIQAQRPTTRATGPTRSRYHLVKSENQLPEMGHAEVNPEAPSSSTLADKSHPGASTGAPVSSMGPAIFQIWKDLCKDLTNIAGRSLRDLYRIPEGSLGKDLEAVSETRVDSCYVRQPRSDSPSPQLVSPGKQQLEGILKTTQAASGAITMPLRCLWALVKELLWTTQWSCLKTQRQVLKTQRQIWKLRSSDP